MSNKTRKASRPMLLAAALGVVAMLAILSATVLPTGPAQAQGTNPFAPGAPSNVSATVNDAGTGVVVSWDAGAGASGYEVERRQGDGEYAGVDPAHSGTATSYGDDSVSTDIAYTYRVRATNAFGASGWDMSDPITVPAPENQPPELTGVALTPVSLRYPTESAPIDVSVAFSDPDEDDELTYSAVSSDPNVATVSVTGSMMTIASENRGTAVITVTAADGNDGMISTTVNVTVVEGYSLTADPIRDAADPTIYVVEDLGRYTAKFNLGVGGSQDDVTVTVTASEPDNGGITITDSDGLIGAGFNQDNDLEGSLTVKFTDDGSRAFEIEGVCEVEGAVALIKVEDKDLDTVATGSILCEKPAIVVPEDRDDVSDQFTIVSYGDWEYEDVTDGFILDSPQGNQHLVNAHHTETGLLSRDEPVIHTAYTLGESDVETLGSLPGGLPRRAKADDTLTRQDRNAYVEEGQRTIEVLVGTANVQLTVTSIAEAEGPAYIRFLDSDMMPFGTDVDEEPEWRGADVVGLDSQGRLELKPEIDLSSELALAYDQYVITTPGDPTRNSYLTGRAGTYNQGAFRFFNPCPAELGVDHEFYVQVYEKTGKYLRTTEKIDCVPSPKPGPTGLEFTIDSQEPGEGVLRFEEALNAVSHTALLIDAHNRNIVRTVPNAVSPVEFDNLNSGWTYHIVVLAEGADDQYTAHAVKDYSVKWLGEADVPLSRTPSAAPTRQHDLCKVDDAAITALLSDCDAAPMPPAELGAPTNVTATVDDSDPGSMSVTIMWTDGANADRHIAVLFDSNWEFDTDHVAGHQTDGMVTFNNVPAGIYTAAVISIKDDVNGNAEDIDFGVASVTVN